MFNLVAPYLLALTGRSTSCFRQPSYREKVYILSVQLDKTPKGPVLLHHTVLSEVAHLKIFNEIKSVLQFCSSQFMQYNES